MSRENLLFAIIGILLGFIVGFMFASSMSQKQAMQQQAAAGSQSMPQIIRRLARKTLRIRRRCRQEVTASLEKARNDPKNFDAQIKAAQLYYQIQRYDQSIEYLLKANQLRPTDYQTVVTLGVSKSRCRTLRRRLRSGTRRH